MTKKTHNGGYNIGAITHAGEVGGGKVFAFPSERSQNYLAPVPNGYKESDCLIVTICGNSLESDDPLYHIPNGAQLLIRTKFERAEICERLCLIRIDGTQDTVKYVRCNEDDTVTLICNNRDYPNVTISGDAFEVLGVVEMELKKPPNLSK